MTTGVHETKDAYLGLENPTWEQWHGWHRSMLEERGSVLARCNFHPGVYDDPGTAWSDTSFRQLFLFMYDASFFDCIQGCYRTAELVDASLERFGRIDSVLLWHAYPRLGFDLRTQFDFYRDMPGGMAKLRSDVTDVLHARGVRVFVGYNPWDEGAYEELAQIVRELDADGVMLDTMAGVPPELEQTVRAAKESVVFAPELAPRDEDLRRLRQSWAQWSEVGEGPTIYRHRWLVPRHRQLAVRRWDTSRKRDIVHSFFNGSGLILWDNVFGTWNPYSREDRRLIAETAAILDQYGDLFVHGEWLPLIPTGTSGLDANCWRDAGGSGRSILTLRNRTEERVHYRVPDDAPEGLVQVAFWGDEPRELSAGDAVAVEPLGVQAVARTDIDGARRALAQFELLSKRASVTLAGYEERTPNPQIRPVPASPGSNEGLRSEESGKMIEMPSGRFEMSVRHERRECGCYPLGATPDASWGWFYKDVVTHELGVTLSRFAIRKNAVTNAEFLEFVHASGYRPADEQRFLEHIVRAKGGTLPTKLPYEQGALPVTFISLADARAYAASKSQRLPTEAEWQWAAEGAGQRLRYPWGNAERGFPRRLRPAYDPATATPQGVMGLSGNAWELTESEHTDGHTRFVMLRGGVFLPPGQSEWLPPRGAQPNDFHAKYILLADGLDRSGMISFRTVVDVG